MAWGSYFDSSDGAGRPAPVPATSAAASTGPQSPAAEHPAPAMRCEQCRTVLMPEILSIGPLVVAWICDDCGLPDRLAARFD